MLIQKLEELEKYRIWEQFTQTGRRNVINYGKLLSFLSDIRRYQHDLGCGRVYTSSYLGVEPKSGMISKEYILVIELLPARGATYENKPIGLVRFVIGGGKKGGNLEGQVILHLRDLQTKMFRKTFVFNCENPVETVKPILKSMYDEGMMPIRTSDFYFGQYKPELQYVFNNIIDRLDPVDIVTLKPLLSEFAFTFTADSCRKEFGNFVLRIYRKNMFGSYILALQDLDEKLSIHWALKGESLTEAVRNILLIYENWREDTKGTV